MNVLIATLLASPEPSLRYKVRVGALGEDPESLAIRQLRGEIRTSQRVQALLNGRDERGHSITDHHAYKKWTGAHWVLATLADIGYPPADKELVPVRDRVLECWLNEEALQERVCTKAPPAFKDRGVPIVQGRARRCASQQGNALFSMVALGLVDDRCRRLADCLIRWQWPDGGWNCDRRPGAATSSFWESLIPLRGLSLYAQATGYVAARNAAEHAAALFLERQLFRRRRDGQVMNPQFLRLHYPCYAGYDILFGLKVMAEAGFIQDKRCAEALDILESKRLSDGGWPAEERFYRNTNTVGSGYDIVPWGGVNRRRMNEWVTADALFVLRLAGRLTLEQTLHAGSTNASSRC